MLEFGKVYENNIPYFYKLEFVRFKLDLKL